MQEQNHPAPAKRSLSKIEKAKAAALPKNETNSRSLSIFFMAL